MTALRRRMTEDLILRNRAPGTIRQYVNCAAGFARHFNASPEGLGPEQVRSYLLHLVQERHVSWSYYNQSRCALQFLYRVTLGVSGGQGVSHYGGQGEPPLRGGCARVPRSKCPQPPVKGTWSEPQVDD